MGSAFPRRPSVEPPDRDRADVDLTDATSSDVFDALSSETGRKLLRALADDPLPASDLADEVELSLQTVHYHLGKLEDAGLVERVGTWYSSRGREMAVYASTAEAVTIHLHP